MSNFGFGNRIRERDELENMLGTEFVDLTKEPYPEHKGNCTEIHLAGGGQVHGVYRGLTKREELILFPYVDVEIIPFSQFDGKTNDMIIRKWSGRGALHIKVEAIMSVRGKSKEYLDSLIELGKPKIILP